MTDLSNHRPDFEAEFTPERRAALYQEIMANRRAAPARRPRLLVGLAVAAAVVTALALVVPAIIQARVPGPAAQSAVVPETSPTPDSGATAEDVDSTTPSNGHSREPGTLTWQLGGPADPNALEEVAVVSAGVGQRTPGSYVHIIEVIGQPGPNNEVVPQTTNESYIDSDGWIWERRSYAEGISGQVEWYKHRPNPDHTQVPTDPAALDAHFRAQSGTNSADERVFKSVSELLTPHTSPELRAAALRVLAMLAENPQEPGQDKEGTPTNPRVTLTEITFSDGTTGYRAHFEDPTSRPGDGHSIFINADGIIVGGEHDTHEDGGWATEVILQETTPVLPDDFARRLGADQVPFDQIVVDEG
ncbi:MAG: hypothetical protein Q4D96_00360 [Propionibacteriaceae bacterium]|nr:hypothetical protein [Propionibacteriaceae bacterium]